MIVIIPKLYFRKTTGRPKSIDARYLVEQTWQGRKERTKKKGADKERGKPRRRHGESLCCPRSYSLRKGGKENTQQHEKEVRN